MDGFIEGECMVLRNNTLSMEETYCTMTLITGPIVGDVITVQGLFNNMVVTGSLGCFFGVSGTITGAILNDGFSYTLNFDADGSANHASCDVSIFDEVWTEKVDDVFVDYLGDGESAGDVYLVDSKSINIAGDANAAVLAGSCIFTEDAKDLYCNLVFTLDNGSIALQGYWFSRKMSIVGGSGCYGEIAGFVKGFENTVTNNYEYTWTLE